MKVFISYRRADTQDLAGRIADRLRGMLGIEEVFLDVTGIAPGADFAERIESALSQKPVCVVLIGPLWRGQRGDGDTPRILDAKDVVRLEITRMLNGGLRILPVLAGGATMPSAEDLPEDLRHLASINALPVGHTSFERDFVALTDAIFSRGGGVLPRTRGRVRAMGVLISFLLSCAGLLVAAVVHNDITGRSLDETLGGPGQVWLLIAAVLALGTLSGTLLTRHRT